jgi:PAS domain S-box-containing protein
MTDTTQEIFIAEDEFIVSKTDRKGKITYGNRIFINISGYRESDLIGQPHNIIRHPDMPRAVFQLLWKTLQEGSEFFGFIKNRTKQDNYYWAFANVTPSYDPQGQLLGYYSVRRCPSREGVETISRIYREMRQQETQHSNPREGMEASTRLLQGRVNESGLSYEEFILSFAA